MRKLYLEVLLLLSLFLISPIQLYSQNNKQFYFFSGEDIHTIKKSSTSGWGQLIVKGFKDKIKEREIYTMDIPKTGGSYIHNYFCPVHNIQFTFNWNSSSSHYCEVCKKSWTGEKKYDDAWIAVAHGKNPGVFNIKHVPVFDY